MVVCSNRQASDVTCTDQARCWWPAKLGNISTAFLCPLDTRFHRKQRHFGRKGFGVVVAASSGRCAAGRARTGLVRPGPAWRWSTAWRRDVRWPSSIHPAFPRWPQSGRRTADPAGRRRDCSLPAQLNPINLRHPSVSPERPVDRARLAVRRCRVRQN